MSIIHAIESTIAAEREARWDGDLWRSYCAAQDHERAPLRDPLALLSWPSPSACSHLGRITQGETGSICLACKQRWPAGPARMNSSSA